MNSLGGERQSGEMSAEVRRTGVMLEGEIL